MTPSATNGRTTSVAAATRGGRRAQAAPTTTAATTTPAQTKVQFVSAVRKAVAANASKKMPANGSAGCVARANAALTDAISTEFRQSLGQRGGPLTICVLPSGRAKAAPRSHAD